MDSLSIRAVGPRGRLRRRGPRMGMAQRAGAHWAMCAACSSERPPRAVRRGLAGLAVLVVPAAVRAVLLQRETVGVVPTVLARDVVAVLALLAGQGDLRPHVSGSHVECLSAGDD